jgi:hypothetical protein
MELDWIRGLFKMKRIPTHNNVVAFPKHLKGKVPKDCMCPCCEVVLESGLEYELYSIYDGQTAAYLLQVFIESGQELGISSLKEAVQSLNRERREDNRKKPFGSARATARSAININNNCNTTTGSVRTTSQKVEEISKILFPATKALPDKREGDMFSSLKSIKNILYGEAGVKKT